MSLVRVRRGGKTGGDSSEEEVRGRPKEERWEGEKMKR